MTCIVAYKDETTGHIYVGADSGGYAENSLLVVRKDPKIFIKGKFIFGYSGSFRDGQILMNRFNPAPQIKGQSDFSYMCTYVVDNIVHVLKEAGRVNKESDYAEVESGIIIVYNGEIYAVYQDLQVEMLEANYNAVGSGADFALGALYVLHEFDIPAEQKVDIAVKAACSFSPSVKEPVKIISTLDF